jgi:hypothetical protein
MRSSLNFVLDFAMVYYFLHKQPAIKLVKWSPIHFGRRSAAIVCNTIIGVILGRVSLNTTVATRRYIPSSGVSGIKRIHLRHDLLRLAWIFSLLFSSFHKPNTRFSVMSAVLYSLVSVLVCSQGVLAVGTAFGYAAGTTGGGSATPAVPSSTTELVSW